MTLLIFLIEYCLFVVIFFFKHLFVVHAGGRVVHMSAEHLEARKQEIQYSWSFWQLFVIQCGYLELNSCPLVVFLTTESSPHSLNSYSSVPGNSGITKFYILNKHKSDFSDWRTSFIQISHLRSKIADLVFTRIGYSHNLSSIHTHTQRGRYRQRYIPRQ